ncbi:MAG: glutamine--tRNA ligase [Candidatus Marinimicrobia bacterium]|nr:glutamine--tRNA ligase [Candidatus Neomarinimicrobiota bacterium]|tara:strand:+ start:57830 stop:59515 length:1686 start_codon:yes stop_codon:yes gene_type:complete
MTESKNFIQQIIEDDLSSGKHKNIITRFPPEPNGYLHIGHAKSICINFGFAEKYNGQCNLRFDDTNPSKEEEEYVSSIIEDVRWLGFEWGDKILYASDYFDEMYTHAETLVKNGKAFICDLSAEEINQFRGTLTKSGRESPFRNRPTDENLDLFRRMKAGEFSNGSKVLRAKIDMNNSNLNMRDPVLYRILHESHHRTGDAWCIYPMYDWAHGLEDSIEGITHSLCTLEFEDHRPLYDWFLEQLNVYHPRQIEFARLNLNFTVMSKRMLLELVEGNYVSGWNDPRMPTISGMRRRGYSPASIRKFAENLGVAKREMTADIALLEHSVREDLNKRALRFMGVLDPLKIVIENFPEDKVEEVEGINNPEDPSAGKRKIPFSRELFIEKSDFMEDAPKKFFRLTLGKEVRLRYAYFITCKDIIKNENGEIVELRCTYDPETKGGSAPDGRKVKGTLHWVSAENSLPMEVRLYDRLFTTENPAKVEEGGHFTQNINPNSLSVLKGSRVEPAVQTVKKGETIQFERQGYFCLDSEDFSEQYLIFNRTVSLRDTWKKIQKKVDNNFG